MSYNFRRRVLAPLLVMFGVLAPCPILAATTILNTSEFDNSYGTYWAGSSNSPRTWVFDPDQTPSANVGPSGPKDTTHYIFTEASSGAAGDEWYLTTTGTIDATTWDATLNFWYNKYHDTTTTCNLQVQVSTNGGTSWSTPLWSTNINQGRGGATGTTWLNQSVDLSAYDGPIKVRFKASSGGAYQCDTALDYIVVSAVPACVSTTGPPVINAGVKVNGNPIDICNVFDLAGSTLSNITVDHGGPKLYDGVACGDITTTGWPVGVPPEPSYTSLNISVLALDNCGLPQLSSGTFDYSACMSTTGPIRVIDNILLSGTTTDVTRAISANGATLNSVKVFKVVGTGTDIDVTENFEGGGVEGWGSTWTATLADGVTPQTSPPANGDLATGSYTRTEETGPSAPYDGDFLYYEASSGASTDRYLVNSTVYDAGNNELQVSFKYLMNGADVGTLELQVKNPNYNGGAWTTEWSSSGSKGDAWKTGTIDLRGGGGATGTAYVSGNTQIRFRFTYGGGNLGDIAIDAVHVLAPRAVDPAPLFDGDGTSARNASTAGWPDGGVIRIDAAGTNDCGGALKDWAFGLFRADAAKPTMTSFLLPNTALSPVQVFNMSASDNDGGSGIGGYLITESAAVPSATAGGWTNEPPLRVTTASTGAVTFYGWAKDNARNISDPLTWTTTVGADVTAPLVSNFVLPTVSFSPIPISAFAAGDDSGVVTGYMITTSSTPPAAGAAGWQTSLPTSFTTAASGPTTFYAWAKDSAGNVSAATADSTRTVDVKVDVNPPVVTFDLPASHDSYIVPVSTLLAGDTTGGTADNTGVAAYLITTSNTVPNLNDSGWKGTPPTTVTVSAEGAHTFWAWAKDNAGNISAGVSDSVTVTLPPTCNFAVDMAGTLVETENYTVMGAPNPWAWDTILTPLADASVQSALNNGTGDLSSGGYLVTATGGTGSTPQGSRADYPLFFTTTGTYCIWIRALDASGTGGGDSNFWGVDGSYVGAMTQAPDNQWAWTNGLQNGARCTTISVNGLETWDPDGAGPQPALTGQWHTINIWPREEGQKNDMFLLTTNTSINAGGLFTGNNDQVTVIPAGATVIDPTCVDSSGGTVPGGGGSSDHITIPDGQSVIGSPLDVEKLYTSNLPNPLEWRALGAQSDGFEHFGVDSKWNYTNIGNDPMDPDAVAVAEGQGILRLTGGGADIWGTTDYFSFLYQPDISGDFTIDAKVQSLLDRATGGTASQNAGAKAGIMVRQSLATNSRNVMMQVTNGTGARLQSRTTDGGTTAYINGTNAVTAGANTWVRLKRSGSTFEGFYSTDNGATWVSAGTTTVSMSGALVIGLGVTSHDTARDSVAVFDNFLFMPKGMSGMSESWTSTNTDLVTNLPVAWAEQDYAIAVRGSGGGSGKPYQCNSFTFNPCVDTTPSTLTIKNAMVVGGDAVSLNSLFDHSGNPSGFKFEVNGNQVLNPWNSYSLVPSGTSANVTFKVSATDADCSGSAHSATGTITVNNSCDDPTPSTITILTGQIVGGAEVDLTKVFSSTGNVSSVGFTFKVNGVVVADPTAWDSRMYGKQSTEAVSLEVSSVDPDCGTAITALNSITIDNTCLRSPPSITFNVPKGHVGAGRTLPYSVTIRNEDSWNCGPSTFDVAIKNETNNTDFNPAYFHPAGANSNIYLNGRESATIQLAVPAKSTATQWNTNVTTLEVTSSAAGTHHFPAKPTGSVTTAVFLVSPITHNSVTTGSTRWGGEWGTSKDGSKYGNFDCLKCHQKDGLNIKWTREEIHLPGATWGTGSTAEHLPIQLDNVNQGPALPTLPSEDNDWGNDDPAGTDIGEATPNSGPGRTSSNRVCEVCHTQTQYHRYNTSGQSTLNHFNGRDCTDCHRHSLGFTADCTGCHGNPPLLASHGGPNGLADIPGKTGSVTPGTHYKHVEVLKYPCEYCHAGWRQVGEMPKQVGSLYQINHKFNVFFDQGMTDPTKDNGHYTGQDGVNYEPDADAIAAGRQNADGTIPPGKGTLTCENIYCHGGTESMGGTNPQWNGNISCNSCHGTSANNTPPGYSHTTHVGKRKLPCTDCHAVPAGKEPGYNGHVNGRVRIDLSHLPNKNGAPTYNGVNGSYISATVYESNTNGTDMPPSNTYGTCSNIACHFGIQTPVWNSGVPATCTTCHRHSTDDGDLQHSAPDTGNHLQHTHPEGAINVRMVTTYINKCESCHGGGSNEGEHRGHIDFKTTIGGGMTYDGSTCTSICHDARNITWGDPNPLSCEACHMAPYLGPTVVDPDGEGTGLWASGFGSHLRATASDTINGSTNWDTQCRKCHPYHDGGVTIPLPASTWNQLGDGTDMAYRLGLQYPVSMGIHLGGAGAVASINAKTTEAEICWGCHSSLGSTSVKKNTITFTANTIVDSTSGLGAFTANKRIKVMGSSIISNNKWVTPTAVAAGTLTFPAGTFTADATAGEMITLQDFVSEWGPNDNTVTGNIPYDYGSVSTSNWTSAVWTSGEASFGYKTAAIRSTHAATVSAAAGQTSRSGVDDVGGIRCTYCHDVHDMNRAVLNTVAGTTEVLTGAPHLRGSWMGNPYKEDGAPQAGTVYTNFSTDLFGSVPRGSNDPTQKMGGYWIDQNSGDPVGGNSDLTYDTFGGICKMCHGGDINTLNQYGSQGAGWVSSQNGHANSVKGGAGGGGLAARNIFNNTDRGGSQNSRNAFMAYWGFQEPGENTAGLRATDEGASGLQPYVDSYASEPCANDGGSCNGGYQIRWDDLRPMNMTGTSTTAPDNNYHQFSCSKCHNPHASRLPKLMITNCLDTKHNQWDNGYQYTTTTPAILYNKTASNWTTAQNCHRRAGNDPMDTNDAAGSGAGWNLVTPWTDGNGNYSTHADKTQDNTGTW